MLRPRTAAPILLTAAALLLAGCSSTNEPDPTVLPEVVWEQEGTSPLEADPWVEAAREIDLGRILAANSFDFTIEEYIGTRTPGEARTYFDQWAADYGPHSAEHLVEHGPTIMLPLSVSEAADGRAAAIEFCVANAGQTTLTGEETRDRDLTDGGIYTWNMEHDGELDRIVRTSMGETGGVCDATGAPVGVFDPAPVLPVSIDEDDVRPPLGSSAG